MGLCSSKTSANAAQDKDDIAVVGVNDSARSHTVKTRKTVTELVTLVASPSKRAEALESDDQRVVKKKQKWLDKQKSQLQAENAHDWETIFDNTCKELKKDVLTSAELDQMFKNMGTRINNAMLPLLFSLFDANNDGKVDKTEFLVSVNFLTAATKTKDINDLAFLIFDTNRSGTVSKAEFAAMCYALMSKAKFVLSVPVFRKFFREHLEAEHCVESLDFVEAYEKVRKVITPATFSNDPRRGSMVTEVTSEEAVLTIQSAKDLYAHFIYEGAPDQVNLSDVNRRRVEDQLHENSTKTPNAIIDSGPYDACVTELINLMETDSMARFKEKLRTNQTRISDAVWEDEHILGDLMSKSQFKKWAEKNPSTFAFLGEIQATLKKALYRQKIKSAIVIQRAYRARLRAKLQQLVHTVMVKEHH